MLAALAERRPINAPVALVVAHPDDETLAAGGSLHLMRRLVLVHVTDGAPRRLADAARAGFGSPAAYAAARADELDRALALCGAAPVRIGLGIADQEATASLPTLVTRLRDIFAAHAIEHVLTHAYEGGHPDHDAVALAVHRAGAQPLEFAGYHAAPQGGLTAGTFLAGDSQAERRITLCSQDLARKRAMLACFDTQREMLAQFDPTIERFRPAPAYDFARPPHAGRLLYEEWGWMTGAEWRQCAA